MAINFPDSSQSPFTDSNGTVWTWQTNKWVSDVSGGETPDLQSVTDAGNTTTNDIITSGDINAVNAHMTGGVSSDVGTVPDATGYEINTHNFWEVGAVTVANPITTDLKVGQSGLFVLRDAPTAWGNFYKFKGGTPPEPTSYPAVCPFYVNSIAGETYVGPAIEVQP